MYSYPGDLIFSVNTSEAGHPGPIDEDQIENRHNDAEDLERTGPRHDQPEIDKGDSSSPEGEGEASAGGEKKHHNDGLESNRTIMGAICECADETEEPSQKFVEQLGHKGDLASSDEADSATARRAKACDNWAQYS